MTEPVSPSCRAVLGIGSCSYRPFMPSLHPRAEEAKERLERLTPESAMALVAKMASDPWLLAVLERGHAAPIDRGICWLTLPSHEQYPGRRFDVVEGTERNAAILTADPSDGRSLLVLVVDMDHVTDQKGPETAREEPPPARGARGAARRA